MKSSWPIHLARPSLSASVRIRRFLATVLPIVAAVIALTWSVPSLADWNAAAENIRNHPTWIYTPPPSRTMANGKHGLFIVLHGCDQTHTQIRKFGNLTGTADDHAMVVAVPDVGARAFGPRCWHYDGARDEAGHIVELVGLANNLIARPALNIDPGHVYIVGLSSGGAMALDVGCKAPDVFAGVGAIAGPSVGSSQSNALAEGAAIPATNPDDAVRKCKELAGAKAPHLDKQISIIAFGDMDRNGANSQFRNERLFTESDKRLRAGQIALVSVKWGEDNVKALQKLYGTDNLGTAEPVQGGLGTQRIARKNGRPRIALLALHNVGHAWAAGTGQPNPIPPSEAIRPTGDLATATRGLWIAQSGINYFSHAASWLIGNNDGVPPVTGMPVVSVTASAVENRIDLSGSATDPDGSVTRIDTVLLKETSGLYQQIDGHGPVPMNANGAYSDSFANLANARYKVQVTATDNANNLATAVADVTLGQPQPVLPCFVDNNFNHVQKGRAEQCGSGYACAKGSKDNLGLFNLFVRSSVDEVSPGYFRKGACGNS